MGVPKGTVTLSFFSLQTKIPGLFFLIEENTNILVLQLFLGEKKPIW